MSGQLVNLFTVVRQCWNPAEDSTVPTRSLGMWRTGGVARGKPPNGVIVESHPAQTSNSIHVLAINEVSTDYSLHSTQQQHASLSIIQSTLFSTCWQSGNLPSSPSRNHTVHICPTLWHHRTLRSLCCCWPGSSKAMLLVVWRDHSAPLFKRPVLLAWLLWLVPAAGGPQSRLLYRNTYTGLAYWLHPCTTKTSVNIHVKCFL